jgi:hypothetical protein
MVNASTPWTVRTTKRKLLASTAGPREKQRSLGDTADGRNSVPRNPRQQTLTQIHFLRHRSQADEDDNLRPLTTVHTGVPRKQNDERLQQRNLTLTQMGFVDPLAMHHDQEHDSTPILDASDAGVSNVADDKGLILPLDRSRDVPNLNREKGARISRKATWKRKGTPAVWQESQELQPAQRRRKINNDVAADALEHGRRTSSRAASAKAGRSIALLSARCGGDQYDDLEGLESLESPSIRSGAAALHAQNSLVALRERSLPTSDQENRPPSQHKPAAGFFPRTPSKRNHFVPSSQSPEDLTPETERTTRTSGASRVLLQDRTPLKERSANTQLNWLTKDGTESSSERVCGPATPKRKICVLKLPRHTLQQQRPPVENGKTFLRKSIWSPLSSSHRAEESEKPAVAEVLEIKDSPANSELKQHLEQPLRDPTPEARYTREEDELEIPGSNQVDNQRDPSSSPDPLETQERRPSLRGLRGWRYTPQAARTLQETGKQGLSLGSDVIGEDFAVDNSLWGAPQSYKVGLEQDEPPTNEVKCAVSVAGSQDEGSVLALSPGSSIANSTQFNAELAERIPTSSADASPSLLTTPSRRKFLSASLQLDHEIELSIPRPNTVHQQSMCSITKTVPLNDTSSSPSLPSQRSQRTVYPASLPRSSQVLTQEPTQPCLSMSSMPLAPSSSPAKSEPAVITIKSSSSVPRPFRDIPSQPYSQFQSQSELNVDLILDDGLDAEDDASLNDDLAGTSDKVEREIDGLEDSQIVSLPVPVEIPRPRDQGEQRPKTTEQGSPVMRRRRPRKPVIPPEVRAVLGDSILESVPGPPGWSQRSWDDEPL